jgi:hypothetical protein
MDSTREANHTAKMLEELLQMWFERTHSGCVITRFCLLCRGRSHNGRCMKWLSSASSNKPDGSQGYAPWHSGSITVVCE